MDFYEILGNNINQIRSQKGLSLQYIADKVGMTKKTIQRYETGENKIDIRKLKDIASALGTDVSRLMEGTEDDIGINIKEHVSSYKVPILGSVRAGLPNFSDTNIEGYESVDPDLYKRFGENLFALKIKGDSMYPKMEDGDIVIVKEQPDIESGEIAVVQINNSDATVKRVDKNDFGITLVPLNRDFEVDSYTNEMIERLPVKILGKVVKIDRYL